MQDVFFRRAHLILEIDRVRQAENAVKTKRSRTWLPSRSVTISSAASRPFLRMFW